MVKGLFLLRIVRIGGGGGRGGEVEGKGGGLFWFGLWVGMFNYV